MKNPAELRDSCYGYRISQNYGGPKDIRKAGNFGDVCEFLLFTQSIAMIFVSPTKAKNSRIYGGFLYKNISISWNKKTTFLSIKSILRKIT